MTYHVVVEARKMQKYRSMAEGEYKAPCTVMSLLVTGYSTIQPNLSSMNYRMLTHWENMLFSFDEIIGQTIKLILVRSNKISARKDDGPLLAISSRIFKLPDLTMKVNSIILTKEHLPHRPCILPTDLNINKHGSRLTK